MEVTNEAVEALIDRMATWLERERDERMRGNEFAYERLKGGIDYVYEALGILLGYPVANDVKNAALIAELAGRMAHGGS